MQTKQTNNKKSSYDLVNFKHYVLKFGVVIVETDTQHRFWDTDCPRILPKSLKINIWSQLCVLAFKHWSEEEFTF